MSASKVGFTSKERREEPPSSSVIKLDCKTVLTAKPTISISMQILR